MIYINLLIIFFLNFAIVTASKSEGLLYLSLDYSCSLFYSLALTEGPVSVSALVGENALFHCNGSGVVIQWIADGVYVTDTNPVILDRGIFAVSSISSGTVQSTLTVPATLVNNGTTVQCVIYPGEVTSNNATLTILPGKLCWIPW